MLNISMQNCEVNNYMRFGVLTMVNVKISVFGDLVDAEM
jgi:hypothetical protein